jgi:hypothetical protein
MCGVSHSRNGQHVPLCSEAMLMWIVERLTGETRMTLFQTVRFRQDRRVHPITVVVNSVLSYRRKYPYDSDIFYLELQTAAPNPIEVCFYRRTMGAGGRWDSEPFRVFANLMNDEQMKQEIDAFEDPR